MVTRFIKIKNFKNVCCIDIDDDRTELYINMTSPLEDGHSLKFNDINVLIGPNNIGKSNILEAIKCLGNQRELVKSDKPDFYSTLHPIEIDYFVQDGPSKISSYSVILDTAGQLTHKVKFENGSEFNLESDIDKAEIFLKELNNAIKVYLKKVTVSSYIVDDLTKVMNALDRNQSLNSQLIEYIVGDFEIFKNNVPDFYKKYVQVDITTLIDTYNLYKTKDLEFKSKYGISIRPNIVSYDSDDIEKETLKQMKITKDEILNATDSSTLILQILIFLGFAIEDIKGWYDGAVVDETVIDNANDDIDKRLAKLNNDFNAVFFQTQEESNNELKYTFNIHLDENGASLKINKNGKYVKYERQSTGFRWFFAFYYRFYLNANLEKGSIVLLDEPCKALHPNSIKEFRIILKEISEEFGLTFVVTAVSPFLVDVNHLEEIRIVYEESGTALICNEFNKASIEKRDYLKPISDSLLTENNTLYNNRNSKIVFVEGITDYIYLNAFKELIGKDEYKNLLFFPIGGIPDDSDEPLTDIENMETSSLLLVDGDEKGKKYAKTFNEKGKNVGVISLGYIDERFETIESLFSEDELKEFDFIKDKNATKAKDKYNKDFLFASGIKKRILNGKMFDKTKKNFDMVLKYLSESEINITTTFSFPDLTSK